MAKDSESRILTLYSTTEEEEAEGGRSIFSCQDGAGRDGAGDGDVVQYHISIVSLSPALPLCPREKGNGSQVVAGLFHDPSKRACKLDACQGTQPR